MDDVSPSNKPGRLKVSLSFDGVPVVIDVPTSAAKSEDYFNDAVQDMINTSDVDVGRAASAEDIAACGLFEKFKSAMEDE